MMMMPKRTILVADDEAHITHIVARRLAQHNFDVLTAGDGEEAYKLACEHQPHLIIADIRMPWMSGIDLALKLSQNPETAQIPVLVLTAYDQLIHTDDISRTNVKGVILKPFNPQELLEEVGELLGTGAGSDNHGSDAEAA